MRKWIGSLVLLGVLAGCGKAPTAVDVAAPTAPDAWPSVAPTTPDASNARDAATTALLVKIQAAATATRNWKGNCRTDMLSADGTTDYNVAAAVWERRGHMRAEVVKAGNAKKVGTVVLFDGRSQVEVKTFLFGFLPLHVSLAVDDPRLVDKRGRSLRDTSTERLFESLFNPASKIKLLGVGTAGGEAVDELEVRSPLAFKGVEKEIFGISRRLTLPIARDSYDAAGKRIFGLQIQGMRTNVALEASAFSID